MLVKSFETNHNEYFDADNASRHALQLIGKASLFVDDNKVSLVESGYFTGRRRDNNKRWYRWTTQRATGFYRNSKGNLIPYDYVRYRGNNIRPAGFRNISPTHAFNIASGKNSYIRGSELFSYFATEKFGNLSVKSIYPIAGMYDINSYDDIPFDLLGNMRTDDFKEFITNTFGKKNVRKDLIKASAKVDPMTLMYAKSFRNKVPIDWIVNFLRDMEGVAMTHSKFNRYAYRQIGGVLQQTDPRTRRHLLNGRINTGHVHLINDTFTNDPNRRAFVHPENVTGKVYRNWSEIHDDVYVVPRRPVRNAFKGGVIKLTELAEKIEGKEINGMKITCASHTEVMKEWSEYMNNCISSYMRNAFEGRGVYAGVYEDNKLIANIEIREDGTLAQLLGKYNRTLDKEVSEALESLLKDCDITVPHGYWGQYVEPAPVNAGNINANGINANVIQVIPAQNIVWQANNVANNNALQFNVDADW